MIAELVFRSHWLRLTQAEVDQQLLDPIHVRQRIAVEERAWKQLLEDRERQMLRGQWQAKLVDVKGVGKPDVFRGDPEKWRLWTYQMCFDCDALSSSLVALMRKAHESTTEILIKIENERHTNAQMDLILFGVCCKRNH